MFKAVDLDGSRTLKQELMSVFSEVAELEAQYAAVEAELAALKATQDTVKQLADQLQNGIYHTVRDGQRRAREREGPRDPQQPEAEAPGGHQAAERPPGPRPIHRSWLRWVRPLCAAAVSQLQKTNDEQRCASKVATASSNAIANRCTCASPSQSFAAAPSVQSTLKNR